MTHSYTAATAHTHARTAQNARVHELGTQADHPALISIQSRRVSAAGTADSLVTRGRCVVPHGSVPAPVGVEADAAGLVGIRQSGEAGSG